MGAHSFPSKWREPWFLRKAAYVLVGIVGVVLWYVGALSQEQADALANSPLLATAVSWFAAAKTNRGSDSTTTDGDVTAAQRRVDRAEEQLEAALLTSSKFDDAAALLELTAARLAADVPSETESVREVSPPPTSGLPVYTGPSSTA